MKLQSFIGIVSIFVMSIFVFSCKKTDTITDVVYVPVPDTALPTAGLVAYYPFNGSAQDLSGNGNNGTVVNATLAADRFGHQDSAYFFNGTNSYINFGHILDNVFSDSVAQFSVSGWAKTIIPGSLSRGGGFLIGKSGGGNAGIYVWGLSHYNDNSVYASLFYDSTAASELQVTSSLVRSGPWFHFVYVYDGSLAPTERAKLYINATIDLIVTANFGAPGTAAVKTSQPLTVGAGFNFPNSPNNFYNGCIDDIRIYDRPLTLREIRILYATGKS